MVVRRLCRRQSILVGTPSGVTLAAEGGAHQSITTQSIGIEQPGCISYEPAFAIDVEWTLLAGLASLASLGRPDGSSAYLRLSTRPVHQAPAAVPANPAARERRRRQVLAGAYPLMRRNNPAVTIVPMGAMMTEALAAAGPPRAGPGHRGRRLRRARRRPMNSDWLRVMVGNNNSRQPGLAAVLLDEQPEAP